MNQTYISYTTAVKAISTAIKTIVEGLTSWPVHTLENVSKYLSKVIEQARV